MWRSKKHQKLCIILAYIDHVCSILLTKNRCSNSISNMDKHMHNNGQTCWYYMILYYIYMTARKMPHQSKMDIVTRKNVEECQPAQHDNGHILDNVPSFGDVIHHNNNTNNKYHNNNNRYLYIYDYIYMLLYIIISGNICSWDIVLSLGEIWMSGYKEQ